MMPSLKLSLVLYYIKQIDRELENNNKKKNSHRINLAAPKQTSVWKKSSELEMK